MSSRAREILLGMIFLHLLCLKINKELQIVLSLGGCVIAAQKSTSKGGCRGVGGCFQSAMSDLVNLKTGLRLAGPALQGCVSDGPDPDVLTSVFGRAHTCQFQE